MEEVANRLIVISNDFNEIRKFFEYGKMIHDKLRKVF